MLTDQERRIVKTGMNLLAAIVLVWLVAMHVASLL